MSNQNRKAKVRVRMAKTGAKYTQASRELSARESLESEGPQRASPATDGARGL